VFRASLPLGNPTFADPVTEPFLSPAECDAVLDAVAGPDWQPTTVTTDTPGAGAYAPDIRSATSRNPVLDDSWPWQRLCDRICEINDSVFRYRLSGIPPQDAPSVVRYEAATGDHFRPHVDVGPQNSTRKLTYVVQLTDPSAYQGGDLVLTQTGRPMPREQGTLILFPSFLSHVVAPVNRGVRHVLVGWVHGPTFS
jgi:PKHD-type hydroxylase